MAKSIAATNSSYKFVHPRDIDVWKWDSLLTVEYVKTATLGRVAMPQSY